MSRGGSGRDLGKWHIPDLVQGKPGEGRSMTFNNRYLAVFVELPADNLSILFPDLFPDLSSAFPLP